MTDRIADPVLLYNDLGAKREAANPSANIPGAVVVSNGHHSMSVKEAVRIAQSNNFMGLVCSSRLLVSHHPTPSNPFQRTNHHHHYQNMVPSLIESIKVAGLVLVTDTSEEHTSGSTERAYRMPEGVDGMLRGNGVLRFNEMIDM